MRPWRYFADRNKRLHQGFYEHMEKVVLIYFSESLSKHVLIVTYQSDRFQSTALNLLQQMKRRK